jgi:hypothetical protein
MFGYTRQRQPLLKTLGILEFWNNSNIYIYIYYYYYYYLVFSYRKKYSFPLSPLHTQKFQKKPRFGTISSLFTQLYITPISPPPRPRPN